jgi:hypothetical protein
MKNVTFTTGRAMSRRALLKNAGITLALPFLDAMHAAFAQAAPSPKRFIGILNYFSFHAPYLFPTDSGEAYTSSPYLELLAGHRKDFSIISGLNHPGVRDGHTSDKSFFTGALHPGSPSFKNTISLDQLAAGEIGRNTRLRSLNFSTAGTYSCSYTANGVAVPPATSAARVFARLFMDGTPDEIAGEVARIEEGRSILDRVAEQAKRLQRDVSAGDRDKLDQYFTSVRELEQRMKQEKLYASQPKPRPGVPPVRDPAPGEDTAHFGCMMDVAHLALQADLTRIVTLYFVGTSKTPSKPEESFPYHELSHHGQDKNKLERLAILERDVIREWGGLVGKLKSAPEQGARLLDSTMVMMGAAMGNASSHDATNLPILIAGGGFKHGRHIAHDPKSPPPLCNLWVQTLQHLGVETGKFGTSSGASIAGLEKA